MLCEAAGFDRIIVETVGVGQSEVAVHHLTDCFLLLMLAGAGDQLQGIKRGIMEMCDILAITKADTNQIQLAQRAKSEYEQALHLFPERSDGWHPPVLTISSLEKNGTDNLIQSLHEFLEWSISRNFETKRIEQKKQLFKQEWIFRMQQYHWGKPGFKEQWENSEKLLSNNEISISQAMKNLFDH
jgi:LAO/AO transport system kinase